MFTRSLALAATLTFALAGSAAAAPATAGKHGFDFLYGHWNFHFKVLRKPMTGSHDWYEFDGVDDIFPLMDGNANIDEGHFKRKTGVSTAIVARFYDSKSGNWSLFWATPQQGLTEPPQVGRFENGVGNFYAYDDIGGRRFYVRFRWTHADATHAHFEQAFSADHGKTWETNWISDGVRLNPVGHPQAEYPNL